MHKLGLLSWSRCSSALRAMEGPGVWEQRGGCGREPALTVSVFLLHHKDFSEAQCWCEGLEALQKCFIFIRSVEEVLRGLCRPLDSRGTDGIRTVLSLTWEQVW